MLTGIVKVYSDPWTSNATVPPSPFARFWSRAAESRVLTTSPVLVSRVWRAEEEVGFGRIVAAWGFTSVSVVAFVVAIVVVVDDDEVCCLDFLEDWFVEGGKRVVQISVYGGWGSELGIVKRGVSQRVNGEGGS